MSDLVDMFTSQPLLLLAVLAVLAAMAGWQIQHSAPRAGTILRNIGYLGMAGALLLTMGLAAYRADKSDASLALARLPEIVVQGAETRIPLDRGAHYWVTAAVNGKEAEFMIDTGATFTSLANGSAQRLGLERTPGRMPAKLGTAKGVALGHFTRLRTLDLGTVHARDLEAVIMDYEDNDTNVIGMNLLSRLKSWRVEDGVLTLVPYEPSER